MDCESDWSRAKRQKRPEDHAVYRLSLPPGHLRQVFERVTPDCGGFYPGFVREEMNQHQVVWLAVSFNRPAL